MTVLGEEIGDVDVAELASLVSRLDRPAYLKDAQLRYTAASNAFCEAIGWSREDLVGAIEDRDALGEAGRPRDEAERRSLVFGKPQRIVVTACEGDRIALAISRIRQPDGGTYIVALDAALSLPDLLGQLGTSSSLDLAGYGDEDSAALAFGRPQGEPVLHDEDLQNVIEAMPMGVVVANQDLVIEMVNGPFFDIWKLMRREDLVGRNFRALMDINRYNRIYAVEEDDWEGYIAQRLAEIAAGHVAPREFVRADGVVLMYSVTPLSGGKRMVCYYDVSELREQQRLLSVANGELERTVRLLDDAAAAMAQGLMIYDQRDIVFVNECFYEFLDVPRDQVAVGKPWTNLVDYCAGRGDYGPPEEAEKAREYIVGSSARGEFHQMERRGRDGRWLRIDGKPTAGGLTVVTYSDISELKQRQEELSRLVVRAEDSDRAKSEFLANMSHEIRTPMNGVLGMAELLSKTELDTRQRTYCDIIVKSGHALLTIINDILDFSKIEAGEITLEHEPFDLRDAVEDVASLMATGATDKDLELAVKVAPHLPQLVLGDVGRFRQVLTNLVGNAIKFTERGHVLVELAGKPVDAATVDLTIRVEDTGLGIPADKIEAVFDKFSQVDGSSTRRHEGTGLGLAITSRLVTLMNGQIGVESEVGRGSVFTVDLRMRADQSQKPLVRHFADVAGARVLIVDDNKVNRDILMAQLASWGCDACAAQSAEEGLAFLEAAAGMGVVVDCIVLDHHMPRMTGIEMARELRARPAMADIPVVLLTSVDVDPKADRLAELRLSAWLTKPAREALLLDTLGKVIDRAPADAEADAGAPSKTAPAAVVAPALARAVARPAPKASAASENGPEDGAPEGQYLDLWMDSEGLAESVAGIGAALSWDDADEASHTDRELERRAQSGGRAIADAVAARRLDILVAEDNEVNQIVFSQILDDLDVVYRIVGNGALAVEEYDRVPPRLILMDVSMPVMNGHQASRAIRQKEAGGDRHVPIIGVTAHALKGDREACIEAGMDDYLSKPISPETLEAKIRQWLGARSGPIAARAG